MAVGLTPHQKQTLDFLRAYKAEHAVFPTFSEIAAHVGAKSNSRVSEILVALAERGYIRRLPNKARAIELIDIESAGASLPPHIEARLRSYCAERGEHPADVIADAVVLHLDEVEGSAFDAVATV